MYGYEEYIDLSAEQLLQKITQEEIFSWILGCEIKIGWNYLSPFREDKHPGCRFERREDDTLLFVDFGEKFRTGKTHRSCFGMVMEAHGNVSLQTAIKLVCTQFGLSTNSADYSPIISNTSYRSTAIDVESASITYDSKPYQRRDKIFWGQFIIKEEHLLEDNVFNVQKFTIKSQKGIRTITPYSYCYCIDFLSKKKLYQPYNEKYKWITNCDEDNIGNIDNLPPTGEELIVQKSYKDHRVLRNIDLGLNVIWFQNEGCVPSLEILKNLIDRFVVLTIFFDNDEGGCLAAMKLVEILNSLKPNCARMVHLPIFLSRKLTYKDPGEFVSKEGRLDTIQVIKQVLL